jgi:hypothetical protein
MHSPFGFEPIVNHLAPAHHSRVIGTSRASRSKRTRRGPQRQKPRCTYALVFLTMAPLARPSCPSRFVRIVASPCTVPSTYHAGPFQGSGTVWNLSCTGWRLSGDLPMRPGETLSLTVTLPNEQHITVSEAIVRWSRGQEFAMETRSIAPQTQARFQHYVKRLVQSPAARVL